MSQSQMKHQPMAHILVKSIFSNPHKTNRANSGCGVSSGSTLFANKNIREIQYFLKIITCNPPTYTIGHPDPVLSLGFFSLWISVNSISSLNEIWWILFSALLAKYRFKTTFKSPNLQVPCTFEWEMVPLFYLTFRQSKFYNTSNKFNLPLGSTFSQH